MSMLSRTLIWTLVVLGARAAYPDDPARKQWVLDAGWHVKQLDAGRPDLATLLREAASPDESWLQARMPMQVHDVLLEHGLIPDPHVGKNASVSAWVGEKDWAYACTFASPANGDGPTLLRFGGLDTLASVYLNGVHIGGFDNMFREYAIDVRKHLAPSGRDNVLLIVFSSPLRFIEKIRQPPEHLKVIAPHKYLRKSHGDFSSYLGARPHSVKVGVYRDVVLDVLGRAWIEDVWVRPELSRDLKTAKLRVRIETAGASATLSWTLVDPSGREIERGATPVEKGGSELEIDVPDPKLWWPHTHGTPHLYQFRARLEDRGDLLDSRSVSLGIREIRPVFADLGTREKRFRFDINGQPIFLRGACWAPVEGMTHCWRRERAIRLLDLAQHGHMNILRVWGEGHIPPDEFYEECDRRGILVWQDFMFGYGMHPAGDLAFNENCRAEIEGMIRRLRNHPSILLWVGGNENHMGVDFAGIKTSVGRELFEQIMPQTSARLDPTRVFHPTSPYGGRVPNWPLEGDWHDYTTLTFSPEASVPTFASEVGRVSAPSIASMRRFLSDDELWPKDFDPGIRTPGRSAWPPMWQYRSVGGSWDKVGPVEQFCDPALAADLIRVLGTAHGEYLGRRVERHRRGVPDGAPHGSRRCWGNMIWRLNDPWPIIYWSAIDYYLEPKIPFYFLRRAYEPVLVSFERTADRISVWVVNDSPESATGKLTVRRLRFDGESGGELSSDVSIAPGESKRSIDLTGFGPISLRNEFLHATFAGHEATYLLIGERYLHLPQAKLSARVDGNRIEVRTDVFARQVALEMEGVTGAVFEDNFFDLAPGQTRTVAIVNSAGGRKVTVKALNAVRVQLTTLPSLTNRTIHP